LCSLTHFQESLRIRQRSLVSNHRDLGMNHYFWAITYIKLYNVDQAVKHVRLAVEIRSLGSDLSLIQDSQDALDSALRIHKHLKNNETKKIED
jgi:hypothetical protein